jgi:3-oxoacyl-[acyl-carrier protein] reductase
MELNLTGKTVLITGASKGIGLACAKEFANEGCNLHLASRTAEDLERAKTEITAAYDVDVQIHPMDLSQRGAPEALAEAAGDVDILVNNAGAVPGGDLLSVDEDTWRAAWDLKVFGYINLTRAMLGRMKARGHGAIVNVIGLAGENYDYNYVAGTTGNAGLMAFTRAVGSRSIDDGVRVLAINPGPVQTDRITTLLRARAKAEFGDEERWQSLTGNWPLGRAATAEECADLVVFLASPRASYISGVVYTLDGGLAAR